LLGAVNLLDQDLPGGPTIDLRADVPTRGKSPTISWWRFARV
jgi:hypothetical protein